MNKHLLLFTIGLLFACPLLCIGGEAALASIPLPEHPRPDFERPDWMNLNGVWKIQFDKSDAGYGDEWFKKPEDFNQSIIVPFPWGSPLSLVKDEANIAWYARKIQAPDDWDGKRIFLVIGACDWHTTAFVNGKEIGQHRGGYVPFEFELTEHLQTGEESWLVLRVDDTEHKFKLFGKQGYGNARGIWQTPYLEARGRNPISTVHITPDIDQEKATIKVNLMEPAQEDLHLDIEFRTGNVSPSGFTIPKGSSEYEAIVGIPMPRLWSLDDPFLYEVTVSAGDDKVNTYFGMRKIAVTNLPGTEIPYVSLNNKPVYLQMTLDQAYHPDGYYTFPSDDFMRDEILRMRRIGVNGMREHVKIECPRKLYWADKLGMLIMADVPNSWGEPDENMRREVETGLREMIKRDYNHPSIFSWVVFNETWGLFTNVADNKREYLPETQQWVVSMYRLAKELDPTRLVEDNSACNYDHTETDINTWHAYLPGYEWTEFLTNAVKNTYPGSEWNFTKGFVQGKQPMFNSECGNVWGYQGSTGDVDWSWDYHLMMNAMRRYPQVSGWLYTEHHDVINEWNGYYRFDRSEKFTGMEELVPGMTLKDLHGAYYIALGDELCTRVEPGSEVEVPMFASFMTDENRPERLTLRWRLIGWDTLGRTQRYFGMGNETIPYRPWMAEELQPLRVNMPDEPSLAILSITLMDDTGAVLHRNFTTFLVGSETQPRDETVQEQNRTLRVLRVAPKDFAKTEWSVKQWKVLDGLKVNGAGSGYFEYRLPWPKDLDAAQVGNAVFRAEVSAKQLFGKDRDDAGKMDGDYMLGKGTHDPSKNPNAYPMTDEKTYPSAVRVRVQGQVAGTYDLPDDPADHRGILSWYSQLRDKKLREAGSYGYLISAPISQEALQEAAKTGEIVVRLEVNESLPGGLAIYGERFGRYPLDPSVVLTLK